MIVTTTTPRAYEFACYSKACAPPPAGKGGSLPPMAGTRRALQHGGSANSGSVTLSPKGVSRGGHVGPVGPVTTAVSRRGGVPQIATRRSGRMSYKEQVKSVATPENFPRGDKRKGPTHSAKLIKSKSSVKATLAERLLKSTLAERNAMKVKESAIQKAQAIKSHKKAQKRQGTEFPSLGR